MGGEEFTRIPSVLLEGKGSHRPATPMKRGDRKKKTGGRTPRGKKDSPLKKRGRHAVKKEKLRGRRCARAAAKRRQAGVLASKRGVKRVEKTI